MCMRWISKCARHNALLENENPIGTSFSALEILPKIRAWRLKDHDDFRHVYVSVDWEFSLPSSIRLVSTWSVSKMCLKRCILQLINFFFSYLIFLDDKILTQFVIHYKSRCPYNWVWNTIYYKLRYNSTEAYSCHIKEKILCRYNDIYVVITTYYVVITTYDGCRYNEISCRYNDISSRYNNILSRYNEIRRMLL